MTTDLTANDVDSLSERFWRLHTDFLGVYDGAALTLIGSQYNLVAGTLAPHAQKRPELRPLLKEIMEFEVS